MANKTKMSKKRLEQSLDKYTEDYKEAKRARGKLELESAKLLEKLDIAKDKMTQARSKMFKLNDIIGKMDLADSEHVVLYDTEDLTDIAYIVDGEECHLNVDSNGVIDAVPMKKHKKLQKEESKAKELEDQNKVEDEVEDEVEDF